ncbi:MAG TPA: N-formylglutamate amidohydrolase [Rhodobacteraceae bacterium]|nr:N-formylglutamate amidohydrolase [Paracoccaceae bacterium]
MSDDGVVTTEGLADRAGAVVLCEHASCAFPLRFGDLGLSAEARISHAAWDPGALELARALAATLEAPLVHSQVSRLLYDCNRPPEAPGAILEKSERFEVPGNRGLDAKARAARVREIYQPFCAEVDRVMQVARPEVLITMHTFTPVYNGQHRAVEIGVLHDADSRLADVLLALAGPAPKYDLRRNAPYGPLDGVTHSLKLHGMERGLLNVMIEVRNDLVATPQGLAEVSGWLNPLLARAVRQASAAAVGGAG